jgi:hypothetical protein
VLLCLAGYVFLSRASVQATTTHVLPLSDLLTTVTRWQSSDDTGDFTAHFRLHAPWSDANNDKTKFSAFTSGGANFSPLGSWHQIFGDVQTVEGSNEASIEFLYPRNSSGTIWIQYEGGPNDSIHGEEFSIIAARFGVGSDTGGSGRPGVIVPITAWTPDGLPQAAASVPFDTHGIVGTWGDSEPRMWQTVSTHNGSKPGSGWESIQTPVPQEGAEHGGRHYEVSANLSPGVYYIVGAVENCTPNGSYNPAQEKLDEFSAVMRKFEQ